MSDIEEIREGAGVPGAGIQADYSPVSQRIYLTIDREEYERNDLVKAWVDALIYAKRQAATDLAAYRRKYHV